MKGNFETCLRLVLAHEGGFADHPDDPGGATMRGVTLATFRRFFGDAKTVDDLKAITWTQLLTVYREYWNAVRGDDLPAGIDYVAFDGAVNSGPGRSIRWLQEAADVRRDGVLGPVTMGAIRRQDPRFIVEAATAARREFLKKLDTYNVFGLGWTRRVHRVRSGALLMVDRAEKEAAQPKPAAEEPAAEEPDGPLTTWARHVERFVRRMLQKESDR